MSANDTCRASSWKGPEPEPIARAEDATQRIAEIKEPIQSSFGPIIAVDLDDVLCSTNAMVAQWHNETYGTQMTLNDFYYYYYWKNPFWGSPSTTRAKIKEFYRSGHILQASPVPGARKGIDALRALGYRLIIVTARDKDMHAHSWAWVERWFTGCFDRLICTGQFMNLGKHTQGMDAVTSPRKEYSIATELSKAEVCVDIGAVLLIDDSMENALGVASHIPLNGTAKPPPVLLFGAYEWNKRLSHHSHEHADMVYENRFQREGEGFLDEDAKRGDEALANAKHLVYRVKDWSEAVRYVKDDLM